MVRIRLYSLVLSAPIILFLCGMAVFVVNPLWAIWEMPAGWLACISACVLQALFLAMIACPECAKSPYLLGRTGSFGGFFGKPFPDVICSSCGFDLRKGRGEEHHGATQDHEQILNALDAD
ncbi:hypothetical protein [Brevundimonas nasdae]|uniref:C2H2-type domain-containing protein n=1 Tax=Brevundimonas nasdae TaxID=172043 RepID=A0ABX8TNA7_9CAUL|nr:hypothetical protein [Brevundimonas nasdae]QYC10739.1 hypothetical protein KWG56_01595 [Brevundimonas nasdae]QYC13526.1 hypothetical protein KWG63_15150 [Brevundimonas nasdae]